MATASAWARASSSTWRACRARRLRSRVEQPLPLLFVELELGRAHRAGRDRARPYVGGVRDPVGVPRVGGRMEDVDAHLQGPAEGLGGARGATDQAAATDQLEAERRPQRIVIRDIEYPHREVG